MTGAVLPGRPRLHSLLVSDSETRRRAGVARWVDEELSVGAKVFYTGWMAADAPGPERHWLAGPGGARGAREALVTGQLELLDMAWVIERTGRRGKELAELNNRGTRKAIEEGWTRVAMSADSPHRPMDEGDAAELEILESSLAALTAERPVTVLCQIAVPEENEASVWETVAAHHRDIVDETWSAREVGGVWCPRGELDAYVARRFGSAVHAALRRASAGTDPPADADPTGPDGPPAPRDLHVDLSGVEFMDVTCAQLLVLAARDTRPGQRVVLHQPRRTVRRLIDAVGRPRGLMFSDTGATP